VIFDFLTNFKQKFDDADIRPTQVLFWIQVFVNKLRTDSYEANNTGSYISTYSSVTVLRDNKDRPYFDLPVQILDLTNERGINYITYNEETCCCAGPPMSQVFFQPTKVSALNRLYGDEYEKPSTTNPYFYRIGDRHDGVSVNRVYLLGVECIVLKDVEIGILSALDPRDICSYDDEVPLAPDLIEVLQKSLLALGRFVMLVPDERVNDGSDSSKSTTAGAPVSNAPQNVEPQQPTE
jgi:hypothetical protein